MIYQLRSRSDGAALAPLSNLQKQYLAALAHYAYAEIAPDEDFDDWRHEQVFRVVNKPGLRQCVNEDFNVLKSHWLNLAGKTEGAFKAAFKSISEPRSWAMFSLRKEAKAAEDVMPRAMDYASGMIRNIAGIKIEEADEKLIWRAVYAIRRKAQKERRNKRGGGPADGIKRPLADVIGKLLGERETVARRSTATKPKARRCVEGPF